MPVMRRSTWNALHDPFIVAASGAFSGSLELIEVADLPIAALLPSLHGHDGAFRLRFAGDTGLEQGPATLTSPELGTTELFLTPVGVPAHGTQTYEAIVDRTVRIAGINEEGTPVPVEAPAARAAQPAVAASSAATPTDRKPATKTPVLRRSSVTRSKSPQRVVATLALANTRDIVGVRATLMHGSTVVARAFSPAPRPHQLRLSLTSKKALTRSRYLLVVRMIARDGSVTTVRRSVKLG